MQILSAGLDLKEFDKSLGREIAQLSRDLKELEKGTPESLWKKDLDVLDAELDVWSLHPLFLLKMLSAHIPSLA